MEDLWWSSDSDGEIENKDFFRLLGKLEKLDDEKKWGVGESDTEDFYKIVVQASAMAQSFVEEGFLTKTMAGNLKCLVRGENQTIRLLNHFNLCFRIMSSTFSEFGNALSLNERHIPTGDDMVDRLGTYATMSGGSKILFHVNKIYYAFKDGNLGSVRSELIKAKAEMGILSDKLDDYFKLGVKLGLPTATCSVKRITESSSKTVEPRGLKRTGESSSEMVEPSLKKAAGESSSVTRDDSQPNNETVGDE